MPTLGVRVGAYDCCQQVETSRSRRVFLWIKNRVRITLDACILATGINLRFIEFDFNTTNWNLSGASSVDLNNKE